MRPDKRRCGGQGLYFHVLLQEATSYRMKTNLFEMNHDGCRVGGEGLTFREEEVRFDPGQSNHRFLSKEMAKDSASSKRAIFWSPWSIWMPTHGSGNPRPHEAEEWTGKFPHLSSSLLIYRGATECPVLWPKFWAGSPEVNRQSPRNIMLLLPPLSATHIASHPRQHLPALFSGKPSPYTQANPCHPHSHDQGHENNLFFKCASSLEAPTKCNHTPLPTDFKSIQL